MAENIDMSDAWVDVVAAASLSSGDERTLIARGGAIEVYPAPAGLAVPAGASGDVLFPGTPRRAADRPLLEVTAGLKLWARKLRPTREAVLVLTET